MEFDVLLTKDYVPVIYHDFTICLSTATKVSNHLMPLLFHILHCTLCSFFPQLLLENLTFFNPRVFWESCLERGGGGGGGGGG